ncbi:fibroleukin-like [Saccostrea cucullata]|uniref:fibroleukin-like n=1 Tax=Saccostrea cuccullata TaxID=36930 RepID=UPI002ED484C5
MDEKKSNEELLGEHNSTSVIECAVRCQRECSLIGFNPKIKKCRTHTKIFTSGVSNESGWRYYSYNSQDFTSRDCKDLQTDGHLNSGVYDIYPYETITSPVSVYCDMTTMNGGWTTIQKRIIGSLDFNRTWTEYKNGFGSPEQDVWVGNDVIHQLTKENSSSLYVSITLQNGTTLYEMYNQFSVSNEAGKYQLFLAGPATGTLGKCIHVKFLKLGSNYVSHRDGMLNTVYTGGYLSGMYFSTPDRDNDRWSDGHCAALSSRRGGWWFNDCHYAFLNGPWSQESWWSPWDPVVESGTSVKGTTMMIRRR